MEEDWHSGGPTPPGISDLDKRIPRVFDKGLRPNVLI